MSQVYVVCKQNQILGMGAGMPVAAFEDYPSALAYAQSKFTNLYGMGESARDLIFLLNVTPTATPPAPTPPAVSAAPTAA